MMYRFKDIEEENLYSKSKVLFVLGKHGIFNNIVIDKVKLLCKGEEIEFDSDLESEFGIVSSGNRGNIVDFDDYLELVKMPCIDGKWYCSVDIGTLNKKQKEKLDNYIKKPSGFGVLVLYSSDWFVYKDYIKSKVIRNSIEVNGIVLSFPSKEVLKEIVRGRFVGKGKRIDVQAIDLFIMKMSTAYDEYEERIEKVCSETGDVITLQDMKDAMSGVDNYILDDLIVRLVKTTDKKNMKSNKIVNKIMLVLVEEMGAKSLVRKIISKVEDYIELRILINTGIIPVEVKFSVEEVRGKIGEENRLSKLVDFRFRQMSKLSAETTLKDWLYIKMLLGDVNNKRDEISYIKGLYNAINRRSLDKRIIDRTIIS